MANRLHGNIIIIDSAMGNLEAVGGTSSNITNYNIQSIAIWASSTLGSLVLTGANTATDVIVQLSYINAGSGIIPAIQSVNFPLGLRVNNLKSTTVTACSGFVYLA
mgnify:CR=1 FL=1